jgi:hypothetical protein
VPNLTARTVQAIKQWARSSGSRTDVLLQAGRKAIVVRLWGCGRDQVPPLEVEVRLGGDPAAIHCQLAAGLALRQGLNPADVRPIRWRPR